MKVLVMGGGLAAEFFLFYATRMFDQKTEFIQVFDEDFAPPCSLSSTAVASLRGTTKGFSQLGDDIVDGMEFLLEFVQTHRPDGCTLGPHYQIWKERDEKKENKFFGVHQTSTLSELSLQLSQECYVSREECVIFTPDKLLKWLRANRARKVEMIKAPIRGLELLDGGSVRLDLLGHAPLFSPVVVNCLGYGAKIWNSLFEQDRKIEKTKIVSGSYLQWEGIDHDQTFSLTFDETNLIYRKESRTLQIGAVNSESAHFLCLHQNEFAEHLEKIKTFFVLPPIHLAKIHTGVRHKGQKRAPFTGKVDSLPHHQVWALYGLYKSAFTAGPRLAYQLAMDMSR